MFYSNQDIYVIASTGCCDTEIDSLESVIAASEAGAGGCRLDIDLTSDDMIILCSNGSFKVSDAPPMIVSEHTFREITQKFKKVITMGQAIQLIKSYGKIICVDVRNPRALPLVKIFLSQAEYVQNAFFINLTPAEAIELHSKHPNLNIMVTINSVGEQTEELVSTIKQSGLFGIHVNKKCLSKSLCSDAKRLGLFVSVAQVDNEEDMAKFMNWGVNFIITKHPEIAMPFMPYSGE